MQRTLITIFGNIIIAALWCFFIYANLKGFEVARAAGVFRLDLLIAAVNQSVIAFLFLIRSRSSAVSDSPLDWVAGMAGTFLLFLLRPAVMSLDLTAALSLVSLGLVINILACLSLNRSLGIVAADRGIRTRGLYALVRHPMYASEIIFSVGYFIGSFSLFNGLIVAGTIVLLFIRMHREELFLEKNEAYRQYRARVLWKLVPFVY